MDRKVRAGPALLPIKPWPVLWRLHLQRPVYRYIPQLPGIEPVALLHLRNHFVRASGKAEVVA